MDYNPNQIRDVDYFLTKMKSESGFSLIESLLVVVVVGLLVFLLASIPNSLILITKSKHVSLAREIAVKQIEDKRTINYANLVTDNSPISDSRLAALPQGSGTVTVGDCDPTICTNGEQIKEITVSLNWLDNNKTQTLTLKAMIGEGGINQ
ncbi:MAG: prepilin-type N-terminal cleavage/methylation domain-containing protein [Candidatus Daviesbacteria bacterium]|nr:prepilin-type N-terminal cleavage/methylation domain-containing protein [Candidatus Daviesbacteria bacterium]